MSNERDQQQAFLEAQVVAAIMKVMKHSGKTAFLGALPDGRFLAVGTPKEIEDLAKKAAAS
jgi:hypothetical protein